MHGFLFGRFAKTLAVLRGDMMGAEAHARARGDNQLALAFKALQSPLDQDSYSGAMGPIIADLAAYLRPRMLIGRLAGLRKVPFQTRTVVGTGGTNAAWVGSGAPIPAAYAAFELLAALDVKKIAALAVTSLELARTSKPNSELVVTADLSAAIIEQMDRSFVDPAYAATSARPASITNGAEVHQSSGTTVAAIDADLKAMVQDLVDGQMGLQTASWILHPRTAVNMALMRNGDGGPAYPQITATGGTLAGLPVLTTTALAASGSPTERQIVLVEADQVELADEGEAEIEISPHAAVQMDDAPGAGAQQLVSLWQNGMVGVRCMRAVNWQVRRAAAVSLLSGVNF